MLFGLTLIPPQGDFFGCISATANHHAAWPLCRHFQPVSAPRSCTRDEGRPLGAGLQGQAPNHLKLLWSNARVVSVKEKALGKVSGEVQGGERKRTTDEVSK